MVFVDCFGLRFVVDCYDFLVLCLVIGWGLFPERWDRPWLTAVSLETGYDLRRPLVQKAVLRLVETEEPYCLVIAFPYGPFSPLQHLNPHGDPAKREARLEEGTMLLRFAVKLARLQHRAGRRFLPENPLPSAAWTDPEMIRLLEELGCYVAELDQCRFGLRSLEGIPHKKPTRLATSSPLVADRMIVVACEIMLMPRC